MSDTESKKISYQAIEGCLLGEMTGDAIGLPFEGLSPRRVSRFMKKGLRPRLVFGRAMVSDDTEHAMMTAQSLMGTTDSNRFAKSLAWRMRWWLLRLPAGIGLATGRAIIKLWLGFPVSKSGIYSAGNGPAMRAPVIGVVKGHDSQDMLRFVRASTLLTHQDPKALYASVAVAWAAYRWSRGEPVIFDTYAEEVKDILRQDVTGLSGFPDPAGLEEFGELLNTVGTSLNESETAIPGWNRKSGVSGYIYHTLPAVLYVLFKYPGDFRLAITEIIRLGGDTDTTAAILGGIMGAGVGREEIPEAWLTGIADWPLTVKFAERVAKELDRSSEENVPVRPPGLFGPLVLVRNVVFLIIVLSHGFRRLLPPY